MSDLNEDNKKLNIAKEKCVNLLMAYVNTKAKDAVRILEVEPSGDSMFLLLLSMGYKNLFGIGKTEAIYNLPSYHRIKYTYANLKKTHFPNNFFLIL